MGNGRATRSTAFFLGLLVLGAAPCCGGRTEDLLTLDGGENAGGASQFILSGGTPSVSTGGTLSPGTGGALSTAAGGRTSDTTRATGGAAPAFTTTNNRCAGYVPPTATGTLSISSGYVTTGMLKGYGYAYVGDLSNAQTCVVPNCEVTGCIPSFGARALCAAGVVAADPFYDSMVGVGFNLNEPQSGDEAQAIPAPSSLTLGVLFDARGGNYYARVQLVGEPGDTYCVEAGSWTSGAPIDISSFNSRCWDSTGEQLIPGAPIVALQVIVPSDAVAERPFGVCITDVSF